MDSSNCLSYKRLVILHKLRCANCVTKILYFFHTTKLSVPDFSNFIFTRIFFLSRIFEFSNFCLHTEYHGLSRIFFFFFSCPELSNYRIFVFTRNIADSHGFSVPNYRILSFLSRDLSFVPRLVLGPTDRREVIFELSNFCLPWLSVILRVTIRKFANSQIRDKDYSTILRVIIRNNSQIRKFVTKIIPCEKPPGMHY